MRKFTALLMVALMVSPTVAAIVGASPLTVGTDKALYIPGEDVEISGTAEPGASINITVNDPREVIYNLTVSADPEGNYSIIVSLAADALPGHYVVTASTDGETVETSFMVTMTNLSMLVENLLSHVERSQERVEEALAEFEEGVPEDALESYQDGVDAAETARQLAEEGDYSGAIESALQALRHFQDAFRSVMEARAEEALETAEETAEEEAEKAVELRVAIERARAFLRKVNATADRLEEDGYDVSQIREVLAEANDTLARAEELLESGDVSAAAHALADARGTIGRMMGLLHSMAKKVKAEKAEKFVEQMQKRIQGLEDKIDKLRDRLEEKNAVRANQTLQAVEEKLQRIRERLEAGDVDAALDELDDAVEEIDEGIDELNGHGISSLLKEANRVEAKIRALNATAMMLKNRGLNASGVEEEISRARSLLEEMMERLEEGDTEGAEGLLDEAEESLPRNHMMKQIMKGSKIAEKVREWAEHFRKRHAEEDEED
ncbi:hypothetical protein DRO42_03905 [Candidatus Bathyarchaeota archaeon]|nr:MAG: hypothetical protein DRO42_03905 [Candidatus Bathyarchaeota archaeon]